MKSKKVLVGRVFVALACVSVVLVLAGCETCRGAFNDGLSVTNAVQEAFSSKDE